MCIWMAIYILFITADQSVLTIWGMKYLRPLERWDIEFVSH